MGRFYEAVADTTDGTYRAVGVSSAAIAITCDGLNGVVDAIVLAADEAWLGAPENLVSLLVCWVYEHIRGSEVLATKLVRHDGFWDKEIDIEPELAQSVNNLDINEA